MSAMTGAGSTPHSHSHESATRTPAVAVGEAATNVTLDGPPHFPAQSTQRPSPALNWLSLHFPSLTSLHSSAAPTPVGPSPDLQRVFASHQPNPEAAICANVRRLATKVLPPDDTRSDMALRLYFAILDNMTASETARLTHAHKMQQAARPDITIPPPSLHFGKWLGSSRFHSAVLCVAFEVVIYAHTDPAALASHASAGPNMPPSIPSQLWPYTLHKLSLSAWEFLKNLEVCVRHLPSLLAQGKGASALPPPPLKQYLQRLEHDCVAWRVWTKGSPLIAILQQQDAIIQQAQKEARIAEEEKAAATDVTDAEATNSTTAAASGATAPALTCPDASLASLWGTLGVEQLFTRQLLGLSATRLHGLLTGPGSLDAGNVLLECCWELLLEIFAHHKHLLHNRHMDTIILCCIYNICVKIAGEAGASIMVPNPALTLAAAAAMAAAPPGGAPISRDPSGAGTAAAAAASLPATIPLDFKRIISVYLEQFQHNGAMVINRVSTYHASSQPTPAAVSTVKSDGTTSTAATTTPSPSPSASPTPSPPADADAPINIIQFYNRFFIHEIKNFALEHVKPKMMAALKAAGADTFAASTQGRNKGVQSGSLRSPLPGGHSSPYGSLSVASYSPGSYGYSPLRGGRHNHRHHPYALTGSTSANTAASPFPSQSLSSIHAYLSPRKTQMAQNIYLSRMQPSPGNAATLSVPPRNPALPPQPPSASKGVPHPRATGVATGAVTGTSAEENAMQALTSMPLSPGPSLASAAVTPRPSVYHSHPTGARLSLQVPGSTTSSVTALTPNARVLYAFGESGHSTDDINSMLRGHTPAGSSSATTFTSPAPRSVGTISTGGSGSSRSRTGSGSNRRGTASRALF